MRTNRCCMVRLMPYCSWAHPDGIGVSTRSGRLLHRIKACLSAQGVLIIEDIPGLYWPLLLGQWGDGEADGFRMVWSDRDMIFSLREGQEAQDDGPCALTNPNGVFGLNHCCNRC